MKKIIPFVVFMLAMVSIVASTACSNFSKSTTDDKQKMIVCYFSATGTTTSQAKRIAEMTGAELYEIQPKETYTAEDLDWTDSLSRSSVEMHDKASRPALKKAVVDLSGYDVVFIGYPNWWNTCPRIINTFIESARLDGKVVVPFMTSGGSNITNSENELSAAYPSIHWKKGLLMNHVDDRQLETWLNEISK